MLFKDFLQWIRESGERFIVLNADGEPEFMITPAQKSSPPPRRINATSQDKSTVERINEVIAEVAEKERGEMAGWDAMAQTLTTATATEDVQKKEAVSDEPLFQFEEIDE